MPGGFICPFLLVCLNAKLVVEFLPFVDVMWPEGVPAFRRIDKVANSSVEHKFHSFDMDSRPKLIIGKVTMFAFGEHEGVFPT
jgi:hypothetical protein